MKGISRALALASLLLGSSCKHGPRRAAFPTFPATSPFESLHDVRLPIVLLEDDPAPASQENPRSARGYFSFPIGRGFVAPLPCDEGWRWAATDDFVVATHAAPSESAEAVEIVLVVEHSDAMDRGTLESVKGAATSLIQALPPGTRVGVVAFAAEADGIFPTAPVARRDAAIAFISRLGAIPGANVAAGLNAAADLLGSGEGTRRRVLVLADARADVTGGERAASRIAAGGARVDVVAFGGSGRLAQVAAAGGGGLLAARDASSGAALARCAVLRSAGTGPVDAWIVAQPLLNGGDGLATASQLRFMATVDPTLAAVAGLTGAADLLLANVLAPHVALIRAAGNVVRQSTGATGTPPRSAEQTVTLSLLTSTLGGGIGHRTSRDGWTGWRWIGENRHHTHLRFSSAIGTREPTTAADVTRRLGQDTMRSLGIELGAFDARPIPQPVDTAPRAAPVESRPGAADEPPAVSRGSPTLMLVGFVGDGIHDENGVGLALVCSNPECPMARTFATMLSEVRPPGRASARATTSETVEGLARAAGFVYLGRPLPH